MGGVLFFMNKEKNQKKHFLPALRAESSRQREIFRCLLLSHLLHLAKMIFSLLNILASTNTPFFNDTATTEIYTCWIVGSVRWV